MIAIAQAVILEGPACAAVHGHLAEQDAIAVKLDDLAVVRGAVERPVDHR